MFNLNQILIIIRLSSIKIILNTYEKIINVIWLEMNKFLEKVSVWLGFWEIVNVWLNICVFYDE